MLLTTFFCRALIPAGFMPGPGGLMLCRDIGAIQMGGGAAAAHGTSAMDMSGMDMSGMDMSHGAGHPVHQGQPAQHEATGTCPFAAAAMGIAFNHESAPLVFLQIVSTTITVPPEKFPPRGTIVPTRLPRGPPSPVQV